MTPKAYFFIATFAVLLFLIFVVRPLLIRKKHLRDLVRWDAWYLGNVVGPYKLGVDSDFQCDYCGGKYLASTIEKVCASELVMNSFILEESESKIYYKLIYCGKCGKEFGRDKSLG